MSVLTENPNLMLEVLAVMVKRAGGYVKLEKSETLGPFSLDCAFDEGSLYLKLDESLSHEQVDIINNSRNLGSN